MRSAQRHLMKNPQAEAGQFQRRALIGFFGIGLALAGLCLGYFRLQVLQHEEYRTRSEANRIKPRPVVPAGTKAGSIASRSSDKYTGSSK